MVIESLGMTMLQFVNFISVTTLSSFIKLSENSLTTKRQTKTYSVLKFQINNTDYNEEIFHVVSMIPATQIRIAHFFCSFLMKNQLNGIHIMISISSTSALLLIPFLREEISVLQIALITKSPRSCIDIKTWH